MNQGLQIRYALLQVQRGRSRATNKICIVLKYFDKHEKTNLCIMNQGLQIRYALLQVQLLLQVSVSEILTDFLSQKFCWRDFWSSSLTYLRCFVVNWMNLRQSASEKRECAFHRNPPNSLAQKGVSSASYPWFSWKTSVVIGSNIYNIYNIKWQSPDISKVWCVKVIRKQRQKLEEISHHCCWSSEGSS